MTLVLRRAQEHRPGDRGPHDYDVLAGGREVGRIYRINAATEIWSGGISFMLTGRKSYGDAPTRDDAPGRVSGGICALARGTTKSLAGKSSGPDLAVLGIEKDQAGLPRVFYASRLAPTFLI